MKINKEEIYFDTLAKAIYSFIIYVSYKGGVFAIDEMDIYQRFQSGIQYETYASASFPLSSLKGKTTKKHATITLYRMPSGKYELTWYIL